MDVAADAYCYKAVLWGVEEGVIYATSDIIFSPDEGCTRGQAAAFLSRVVDG